MSTILISGGLLILWACIWQFIHNATDRETNEQ